MKQIVCEMCESTAFSKEDGMFVCQGCGMKYSAEEAKKLMVEVEGSAPVTGGAPKVDNSATIENYLTLAKNALENQNNEEAENYSNKVIELDAKNSEAWEIKGEAAGWQSKTVNNRIPESVNCWINAVIYAKEENKADLRNRIANKYANLFSAMVNLSAGHFESIHSEENLNTTINILDDCVEMMNTLVVKAGVSFSRGNVYDSIARTLNTKAVGAFKAAQNDFGPDHHNMQRWQWNNYTKACDNAIKMLEKAAEFVRDDSLGETIYKNMVVIGESARDSQSWKFDVNSWTSDHYVVDYTFTKEAKKIRTDNINGYKDKQKKFKKGRAKTLLDSIQSGRRKEGIALGIKKYWEEHAEEKQKLEAERADAKKKINDIDTSIKNLPIMAEINEAQKKINAIDDEIKNLYGELNSLGFFKMKEKKAVNERIEETTARLSEKKNAFDALLEKKAKDEASFKKDKEKLNDRIRQIEEEFAKERGVADTIEVERFENPVVDGKFTMTCDEFFDHVRKILPAPYTIEESGIICNLHPSMENCVGAAIINPNIKGDNKNTGIVVFVEKCENSDLIKSIIFQGSDDEKLWCDLGSYVMMSIATNVTKDNAEQLICNLLYSNGGTWYGEDDVSIEFADYFILKHSLISLKGYAAIFRTDVR